MAEALKSLVCIVAIIRSVGAAVYEVGDAEGWDSGVNYLQWAQKHDFHVGDTLVFRYNKEEHNVYEVDESVYRTCNVGQARVKMYLSGNDSVVLEEGKSYCFICAVSGHCSGGMRIQIPLTLAYSHPPLSPPPSFPPQFSNTSGAPSALLLGTCIILLHFMHACSSL
ncbi:hypothetical protein SUGI_0827460 [Cryptomeria japonica]|nr:hypothetical protein SUGI_0827460 [Cryptomeria japonica]